MDESGLSRENERHSYLAAPWRMRYLRAGAPAEGCVFCSKIDGTNDVEDLVLWRGRSVFIMMNLFPYSTGHIMIAPNAHVASPEEIDLETMAEIAELIPPSMRALRRMLSCQGFNTGINTGSAAGAGIADHMHLHIVPRWGGDANFMPVVGQVTVMPEVLSVTYAKLRAELGRELGTHRRFRALVVSPDRKWIYRPDGSLPEVEPLGDEPVAAQIERALTSQGIEGVLSGWAGQETLVWTADVPANPGIDGWIPTRELACSIDPDLLEALQGWSPEVGSG
ncbi:MAG: HIT domain-containing protein [Thermomicrobiales bacterium]|nr:HIT domain-containing protein [Thermomicrobiales bacterium]